MTRVPPPSWAEWLLRALPEGLSRDGVAGDLEEELQERAARGSRSSARHWYARQALAIAVRALVARIPRLLSAALSDCGQAVRSLRHAPSFLVLVVLTLALGIGATTAIFSVVDGILLRPLPYPEPERLVVLSNTVGRREMNNFSEPEIFDLMAESEVFEAVAAYRTSRPLLGMGDEPQRLSGVTTMVSLFDVLGVEPIVGRVFTTAEGRPDSSERLAVLSHGLWVRAFAADPDIVGRNVLFENVPTTIVGVMPPGFSFPVPGVDVYRPLRLNPAEPIARNNHYLTVVGRTARGATSEGIAARLEALGIHSTEGYPEFYSQPFSFRATPMHADLVGDVRDPLRMLMAAVVGVLLIAAVNAASLFLARAESRRGEIAVRTALGAARGRVAAQLMAESLAVAALAAVLGSLLAWGAVQALGRLAPPNLPRIEEVVVNGEVLLFGLTIALATGLLFGLVPVVDALRDDVRDALTSASRCGSGTRNAGRFRRGLVSTQLALATLLVLGAGLLLKSFASLRHVDLGFRPEGVLTIPLTPPVYVVAPDGQAIRFYRDLEQRIDALPGVVAVGSALRVPLAGGGDNYSIQVEGKEVATIGESPAPGMEWATPGYFEAMRVPLVRGRYFTSTDDAEAPLVAVVGELTARDLWPGEDPIGKRLRMFNPGSPWMEVVGVVADVKHYGVRADRTAKLYIPHLQGILSGYYSPASMSLVVRADGDPIGLAAPVRAVIRELQGQMPIGVPRTMDEVVRAALAADRFTLILLAGFALAALLLAAVGVYGVVAETVTRRTREIGLRMAVGADRRRILRQVLLDGVILAAGGAAVGLLGGLFASKLLRSMLHEVSPTDPWTYVVVGPLLIVVTLLASLIPALRAARVDPVEALRAG